MTPPASSHTRVANRLMKYRSWLTNSSVPSKASTACSSHSLESMSRWFVGSSNISRLMLSSISIHSRRRLSSPPDSTLTLLNTSSPVN